MFYQTEVSGLRWSIFGGSLLMTFNWQVWFPMHILKVYPNRKELPLHGLRTLDYF